MDGPMVQLDKTLDYESRNWGFKSLWDYYENERHCLFAV